MTTLYYDPMLDLHHQLPTAAAMTTAFYAAPQEPEDAERLFRAAASSMRIGDDTVRPLHPSRSWASALVLAREWGYSDLEMWLVDAIEASFEPTWDEAASEFTWAMGLGEQHPRGQYNAYLAAAEAAGPGRWTSLSSAPLAPCPQVVDVDFPTVALSQAEWIDGGLYLGIRPLREEPDRSTTLRIVGVEPRQWDLNGIDGATIEATATSTILRVPLIRADISLTPGSY